jgi:hypothetical protein
MDDTLCEIVVQAAEKNTFAAMDIVKEKDPQKYFYSNDR